MRYIFVLFFMVFSSMALQGQSKLFSDWHAGLSYYGNNLINPGLQVTGQKILFDKLITNVINEETSYFAHHHYILDANLGFFYDNPTYTSFFNNYILQFRRVAQNGHYISLGLGAGVMRTLLPETLVVNQNGNVSKAVAPGNWYLTTESTIGIGRLWKKPKSWRLQLHGVFVLDYNLGLNVLFNVEYGYLFGYKPKEKPTYED